MKYDNISTKTKEYEINRGSIKMSGELIGEFQGKAIGMRIIELLETGPKIEVAG
jgi:hypothetical protein